MSASMRQWTEIRKTRGWNCRRPGVRSGPTVTAACFVLLTVAPAVSIAMLVTNSSSRNGNDGAAAGVGGSDVRRQKVQNVSEHGSNENTCFTAACNDTAAMIRKNMDRSIEPCDNFYRYACGGYLNLTGTPDDKPLTSGFTSIFNKLHEQIRASVEAGIKPNEPRAYGLVKNSYKSCMNESAIEARGVQPLLANLRRMGGWPMIEGTSWNESNFEWTKAIYELRESGHYFRSIMTMYVVSQLNGTEPKIHIVPPEPLHIYGFPTEDFFNQLSHRFRKSLIYMAIRLGAQNNTSTQDLEETTKFIFNLLKIPISETTINNTATTRLTLTELKRNYPSIPWQEYIRAILPSTVSVSKNEVVIVEKPIYFSRLDKLMSNTSKRVLANYIASYAASESLRYVSEKQQSLDLFGFVWVAPQGNTVTSARRKMCLQRVSRVPFVLDSMYVSRHLSADAKNDVFSIIHNMKKAIRNMLGTTNWLDQTTTSGALRKLDAMRGSIAYANYFSDDILDKIYENLEMDEEKYYENAHKVSLFKEEYWLGKFRLPVVERDLMGGFEITDVIAKYFASENSFAFTVGMLQDNFFSKDRPQYMNYGAIGSIIGTVIIHAFNNKRRHDNERGKPVDWWQPSSENEFMERAQCIVDQYSNYTVREVGIHVDGALTLDENIADNGGIKGAYLACSNWVAKNGEEPKLPGIDMTPNQLFWISKANIACTKYTPNMLIGIIEKDPHGPQEFRIIGPMSNIPEFAKDFMCPPGSKMNPTEKCSIW